MKILLGSSEVHPYSKTGGLADMTGALAKALAQNGHQVGLVTPLYAGIQQRFPELQKLEWNMSLPLGGHQVDARVWTLSPAPSLTVYFIDQPDFYYRPGLYEVNNQDFPDNAARFIFLSKAIVHLARYLPWQPEIVHVHDWQTALVPLLTLHQKAREGWKTAPSTCFTIHNLAYQGTFPAHQYALTNLPWDYYPGGVEFFGNLCCLKAGIVYAGLITTVSPRYAREIATPEFGCGLDGVLRQRAKALSGILNGVDYTEWRTYKNPHVRYDYSWDQMRGKVNNKLLLQKELGLPTDASIPLFGNIGRLTEQKGIDIMLQALDEMLSSRMQFVQLGRGDPLLEEAMRDLARRHPDKVAVRIAFENGLSHRIEAGCDFYLMPSRYEPCGLNQLYSLRYGAIPIVRATGGLDDSVVDIIEALDKADGIKFIDYSAPALGKGIRKALALYGESLLLKHYRKNGMQADFSWNKTSAEYEKVYQALLQKREEKSGKAPENKSSQS